MLRVQKYNIFILQQRKQKKKKIKYYLCPVEKILTMSSCGTNSMGNLFEVTLTDVNTGETFVECFVCQSAAEAEMLMRNRICWAEGCFVSVRKL